ncbi:uncharacterized protein CEXT_188621 [Caerostris extrusa]|uniref:Uncharacterized protein n=1 Tax=Caerostris extrusa TaxID=172846 RepID=A0AAV4NT06_CAEEX|nr:uncharacterized protein CEXT_188621 [Caerostris extrusa]
MVIQNVKKNAVEKERFHDRTGSGGCVSKVFKRYYFNYVSKKSQNFDGATLIKQRYISVAAKKGYVVLLTASCLISDEVIVFPHNNTQIEEVLISDDDEPEYETFSYESSLDEKLRELDLYEDDMTIQQKEELLAVVVASWETAEKEKNRSEFYDDCLNAGTFSNDEIEFSFQESPELSNNASLLPSASSCLDVTLSVDPSNISCYLEDLKIHVQHQKRYSTRQVATRGRKYKSRRGQGPSKQLIGIDCSIHSPVDGYRKNETAECKLTEKETLEISMSSWKPCLSPKETPLTCAKRPYQEGKEEPMSKEEYIKNCEKVMEEFEFTRRESRELWYQSSNTLAKPYHLTKHSIYSQKLGKPDHYDIAVGVPGKMPRNMSPPPLIPRSELFPQTSQDVFQILKPSYSTIPNNFERMTTCSSGSASISSAKNGMSKVAKTQDIAIQGPSHSSNSPSHLFNSVEVILDEKLPHFNNLRGSDDKDLFWNAIDSDCSRTSGTKTKSHSFNSGCETNHTGSDSSDSSSVIDVETVGDDEELILKRKILQECSDVDQETSTDQNKRLKKSAS